MQQLRWPTVQFGQDILRTRALSPFPCHPLLFHSTQNLPRALPNSVQDVTAASRTPAETQAGIRPRSVRSGFSVMPLYLLRLSRNSESDGEEWDSATCGCQHCQNMELALPSETGPGVGDGCNWRTCPKHARVCRSVSVAPSSPHLLPHTYQPMCLCIIKILLLM